MNNYTDFAEVKRSTTIDRVAEFLGLRPKKNRSMCPVNRGDPRELVINVDKSLFYCFGCRKGGSLIDLAAHVNQTSIKEAARDIKAFVEGYQPEKRGLPADGLPYLMADHPEVHKLGLDTATAAKLGIGHAPRGTMKGMTLLPIRDKQGTLLGYCGLPPGTKVKWPSSFKEPTK